MRRPVLILVIAAVVTVLACGTALGAGFALYDWSARGNALGGAMTGRADDPSAIAFNPAGITQIPGSSMMAGLTFIMPGGPHHGYRRQCGTTTTPSSLPTLHGS